MQETIEDWLAQSAEPVDARALIVDASVTGDDEHWTLTLMLESPSGRAREQFTGRRCASLVDVVALQVALAAGVLPAGDGRSEVRNTVEQATVRGLVGISLGVLPGLSSSLQLTGALAFSRARLELGVSYAPRRVARYEQPGSGAIGAELQLVAALVRGCARLRLRSVEVPLCAGIELGVLSGHGFGTASVRTSYQFLGDVVLAPAVRVRLAHRLFAWLEASALFLFARPDVQMRNLPRLYRSEVVAGRCAVGLEWEFL